MLGRIETENPYLQKTTNLWCISVIELINSKIMVFDNCNALLVLSGMSMQAKF